MSHHARIGATCVAAAVIVAGALALTAPVEAGKPPSVVGPFISCANVLCLPCPDGFEPAPPPKKPKDLADCCRCIPVKEK